MNFLKLSIACVFSVIMIGCAGYSTSFFQVEGTDKGVICIDDIYHDPKSAESLAIVNNLFLYYGSKGNVATVTSFHGETATCAKFLNKTKPNIILTNDFYVNTIIPAVQPVK